MRQLRLFPILILITWLAVTTIPAAAQMSLPSNISTKLRAGGVNLQFGFYDSTGYQPREFDDDLPIIARYGAGHVRIPISWDVLYGSPDSSTMVESRYQDIVAFVNRARTNNLVTIVDIHNTRQRVAGGSGAWNEDYMVDIGTDAGRQRHIAGLTALATRLYADNVDRNWFVLQPANEPIFGSNPMVWYNHQNNLIPALRRACPDCVIFAMGHDWQGIETHYYFTPLPAWYDARIMFDFHFYEPMPFTHCSYPGMTNNCPGKTWPGTYSDWRPFSNWDRAAIQNVMSGLMNWKRTYNVEIHFSEMGTTGGMADNVRAAYVADVVAVLRAHNAGYSLYEWDKNFGMYPNHPLTIAAAFSGTPLPTPTPGGATIVPPTQGATVVPPTPTQPGAPTPTPTVPAPNPGANIGNASFVRAINVNGPTVTIDGRNWEAMTSAPNFSIDGTAFCNQGVTLNPATDDPRSTMIRCSRWGWTINASLNNLTNQDYFVYLYVWEDNTPETFSIMIEGQTVRSGYNSGSAGRWERLGPFSVRLTDGMINISASGGNANISGIELWRSNPAGLPTATPIAPTATPIAPTATPILPTSTGVSQTTQLNGLVRMEGRSNHSAILQLDVYSGGARVAGFTVQSNETGTFTQALTGLPNGGYRLVIKQAQGLAIGRDVTVNGSPLNVDFGLLDMGDVNNDNRITLTDFSILAGSFNRSNGQPGFDARADLNADGSVTLPDFSLQANSYNISGASG